MKRESLGENEICLLSAATPIAGSVQFAFSKMGYILHALVRICCRMEIDLLLA